MKTTSFSILAGTYENKIILWDIGGLDRDYNFKVRLIVKSYSYFYVFPLY